MADAHLAHAGFKRWDWGSTLLYVHRLRLRPSVDPRPLNVCNVAQCFHNSMKLLVYTGMMIIKVMTLGKI